MTRNDKCLFLASEFRIVEIRLRFHFNAFVVPRLMKPPLKGFLHKTDTDVQSYLFFFLFFFAQVCSKESGILKLVEQKLQHCLL